jgi:hypothetical protein
MSPDTFHRKMYCFLYKIVVTQGQKIPNGKYLDARLRIINMYVLYVEEYSVKGKVPMKESYCKMIFNTCLNPGFHRSSTDYMYNIWQIREKMKTCDLIKAKTVLMIKGFISEELKMWELLKPRLETLPGICWAIVKFIFVFRKHYP